MKIVVGLGNPGDRYHGTRHNVGFAVLDSLASSPRAGRVQSRFQAEVVELVEGTEKILLVAPETFMNLSGLAVRELLREYEAAPESDLVVIQDELDFSLGTLRIHTRRSSAGHNGIESIIGALSTQDFLRIRIGVAPERKVGDGAEYLLAPMKKKELEVVDGMLDTAAEAVKAILKDGPAAAMNRFNRKEEGSRDQGSGVRDQ